MLPNESRSFRNMWKAPFACNYHFLIIVRSRFQFRNFQIQIRVEKFFWNNFRLNRAASISICESYHHSTFESMSVVNFFWWSASTFFNLSFFGERSCQIKTLWTFSTALITSFEISKACARKNIFDSANDLKTVAFPSKVKFLIFHDFNSVSKFISDWYDNCFEIPKRLFYANIWF